MISKEEVKHIAKLARLELTEKEIEKLQKDMSAILDYFNLLKKAPKPENAEEIYKDLSSVRKDEVISSYNIKDELIGSAPDKKDDYIKVKAILQ
jgi:aspartyl-tRNA(Asn)/glutamyl-tRNA(Gln) amidotransferase subunit C